VVIAQLSLGDGLLRMCLAFKSSYNSYLSDEPIEIINFIFNGWKSCMDAEMIVLFFNYV